MTPAASGDYFRDGWCMFDHDPVLAAWVDSALPAARATTEDPDQQIWFRYQRTWFAGVNALPNAADGSLPGTTPMAGRAVDFIHDNLGLSGFDWDRAQVSICYPGYPQPMAEESEALHRFRRDRDAAHVDGLLREGPERRRYLREYHGFILGIPMVDFDPGASPFVVWRGSHELIRDAFRSRFEGIDPAAWSEQDVTDTYHAARRQVFDTCERVALHARPGEAFLVHRLALHGMAPWADGATASEDGRMIVYFRPETGTPADWLNAP